MNANLGIRLEIDRMKIDHEHSIDKMNQKIEEEEINLSFLTENVGKNAEKISETKLKDFH